MKKKVLVFWNKLKELFGINALLKDKLVVLSIRNARFNIFQNPENISATAYNEFLSPFLAIALGVMTGGETVLRNNMMRAIEKNNGKAPSIQQVIREIQNDKEANIEIKRRLVQRLNALQQGIAGKVFSEKNAIPIEDIANGNFGIALDDLSVWQKNVLITSILCSLIQAKKYQNKEEQLKTILVMDDLLELLSKAASSFEEEESPSLFEKLSSEYARECNISIIASTQAIFTVNEVLLENASSIICFRVGNKSKNTVARIMNLDKEKAEFLTQLQKGQLIIYRATVFPIPVLAQTPLLVLPEVSIEPEQIHSDQEFGRVNEEQAESNPESVHASFSNEEITLMTFLRKNWWCRGVETSNHLGFPLSKVSLLEKELVEKKLIEIESFAVGKGVGNVHIAFFTSLGTKLFGVQEIFGKGGREHAFWAKRISVWFESQRYKTEIEKFLSNGESVDVFAVKDGMSTGIEIGLNKVEREISNVKKLKDFDQIIWATRSEVTLKHFETLVNSQLPELKYKILFMLLKSFLNAKGGMSNE